MNGKQDQGDAATREGRRDGAARRELPDEQREEERRERCVEAEPLGVAEEAAAEDAERGAEHPASRRG